MKYTFDRYSRQGVRIETTTDFADVEKNYKELESVVVTNNLAPKKKPIHLRSKSDIEGFRVNLERAAAWLAPLSPEEDSKLETDEEVKDAINPSHYQGFVMDLQWLETMQYIIAKKYSPEAFVAAVEMQVRKYNDRIGKDATLQEESKAYWYERFKLAYMTNGYEPIRVVDIPKILGEV